MKLDRDRASLVAAGFTLDLRSLLTATQWSRTERRRQSIGDFAPISYHLGATRLRVMMHSATMGAHVPVVIAEDGPYLSISIPAGEILETRGAGARLMDVSLAPRLLEQDSRAGGHFVMPSFSGALVAHAGQPAARIRDRVYMAQEEWEKFTLMNCFVSLSSAGSVLGIVDEGDFNAWIEADLDGAGTSAIWATFAIRHDVGEVLPQETKRLLLRRIAGAGYARAAFAYREYLLERRGIVPLADRIADNPVLDYSARAMRVKIFHGHKAPYRQDGASPLVSCATFAESEHMVRAMHAAGIAKAVVTLVGWNPGGHDGAWPQRFPIEPAFGGEAGLRSLISACRELGYQVVPHDNLTDIYQNSPAFDLEGAARDEHGLLLASGLWAGGQTLKACPTVYLDRYAGDVTRLQELGFTGSYYLDAQATGLWRCHDHRHPADERQFAMSLTRLLQYPRALFGAVSCEGGPAYTLPFVDEVAHLHGAREFRQLRDRLDPIYARAVNRIIPFYNIAVHGLVLYQGAWDTGTAEQPISHHHALLTQLACGARPGMEIAMRELGPGTEYLRAIAEIALPHEIAFDRLAGIHVQQFASYVDHDGRRFSLAYADGTAIDIDLDADEGSIRRPGEDSWRIPPSPHPRSQPHRSPSLMEGAHA